MPSPETISNDLYRTMRLIRRFEERALELVAAGEIVSGIHPCIGQEAVAAGVMAALRTDDLVFSNHRGHGHLLARGSDPARFLAELAGRETGIDKGRGGSFHPSDFAVGVLAATGTVGHGAALAAGAAWALAQEGAGRIAVSVFGDGAVTQGALLEGFNLAALWRVPVVYICENNLYATTLRVDSGVAGSITGRAEAFGIPASTVDGMDAEVVLAAASEAVARARAGAGPSLLECSTYRYHGHHTFEIKARLRYRDEAEIAAWRARDPLPLQESRVSPSFKEQTDAEIEAILDDAVAFAAASPRPDPADALAHHYASGLRARAGVAS